MHIMPRPSESCWIWLLHAQSCLKLTCAAPMLPVCQQPKALCSSVSWYNNKHDGCIANSSFKPKMSILLQKHHPYTRNLNSDLPGDSTCIMGRCCSKLWKRGCFAYAQPLNCVAGVMAAGTDRAHATIFCSYCLLTPLMSLQDTKCKLNDWMIYLGADPSEAPHLCSQSCPLGNCTAEGSTQPSVQQTPALPKTLRSRVSTWKLYSRGFNAAKRSADTCTAKDFEMHSRSHWDAVPKSLRCIPKVIEMQSQRHWDAVPKTLRCSPKDVEM